MLALLKAEIEKSNGHYEKLFKLYAHAERGKLYSNRSKVPVLALDEGLVMDLPSLFLPLARGGYHGLYIECKCNKDTIDPFKNFWIIEFQKEGYCHHFMENYVDTVQFLKDYHDGKIQASA